MAAGEEHVLTTSPGSVMEIVARQLGSAPGRRALVCGAESVSCGEVWQRSNQLGHALRALGAAPNRFVALCTPPGPDALIGLLGILKSGAAILALDASHPAPRLRQILDETETELVVAHPASLLALRKALGERVPQALLTRSALDDAATLAEATQPDAARTDDLEPVNRPTDTAYMIYTSGSTGTPKGVMVPHEALYLSLVDGTQAIRMRAGDRVTQLAPLTFDASVWEHLAPLVSGGEIHCVPPASVADPEALMAFIEEHGITWTYLPPAYFARWLDSFHGHADASVLQRRLASLRCIMFAGDTLAPALVRRWQELMGQRVTLMNFYGPTETTVLVTGHVIDYLMPADAACVPIGRPFGHNVVRVLDEERRPVPAGEPGFLYIGGPQLASGYFRDPDKTADAFVEDPLAPGQRLYCSRDRGYVRPDGELVFLGRQDQQVKVRGRRVELEEIEHALRRHPGVVRAAVVALEAGTRGTLLLGAAETRGETSAGDLRAHLHGQVPDYMVPHRLRILERLPLNDNGKIDRGAVRRLFAAELEAELAAGAREAAAGGDGTPEQAARAAWAQVLGGQAVVEEGSFFDAGGDSLLLFQAVVALRERGYTPEDVTGLGAARLSDWTARLRPLEPRRQPVGPPPATFPLGPMQEEMFLLAEAHPDSNLYHIQFVFECEPLDAELLGRAALTCMRRHPILRTTFERDGESWRQRTHTCEGLPPFTVERVQLEPDGGSCEASLRRWMEADHRVPFQPEALPLFRLARIDCGEARHLVLTFFHAILDGWSFSRLVSELSQAYRELLAGGTPADEELDAARTDEYVAFVEGLRRQPVHAAERAYWQNVLRAPLPIRELAAGPSVRLTRRALYQVADPELRAGLLSLAARFNVGLHKLLLAAYFQLHHRLTGHKELLLGNTVANRPFELRGIDRSLGCFISILPIRIEDASLPFARLVPAVTEAFDAALRHSRVPNEAIVQELLREPKRAGLCWRNIFAFDNFPEDHSTDVVLWPPYSWNAIEPFDLALSVIDMHARLYHYWNYRSDLLDEAQVEQIGRRYLALLQEAVDAGA